MEFIRFENLIFLLALPFFFIFYLFYDRYRKKRLREYASPSILSKIAILPDKLLQTAQRGLILGAWIFATIAIMQPVGNPHYLFEQSYVSEEETPEKETRVDSSPLHEIIFLLDASSSMLVQDTRKGISRFESAKEKIDTIASRMEGKTVSLYAFTSEPIPVVPATNDLLFLRLMAKNVSINEEETAGTDFMKVFSELSSLWKEDKREIIRTVILLSDGDDTSLEGVVDPLLRRRELEIFRELDEMIAQNVSLFVIGFGSEKGGIVPGVSYHEKAVLSKMNVRFLEKISQIGDGELLLSNQETPIGIAVESREFIQSRETEDSVSRKFQRDEGVDFLIYDHYFQYPLFIAVLLLGFAKILPKTRALYFIGFLLFFPLYADVHQEFEQGKIFYETKQYERAEEHFLNALNESNKEWEKAVILYNLGTVYLRQNEWDKAINRYLEANKIDNIPPYLISPLETNFGIALIHHLETLLEDETENPFHSAARLTNPISLLNIASNSFQKAQEGICEVIEIEETEKKCTPNPMLLSLMNILEILKIHIREKEKDFAIQTLSYREGVQILSETLKKWIAQLQVWNLSSDQNLPQEYFQQMYLLIRTLKNRTDELSLPAKEVYLQARKEIRDGVKAMEKVPYIETLQHFENAKVHLDHLLNLIPVPSPLLERIQTIANTLYRLLIDQKIPQTQLDLIDDQLTKLELPKPISPAILENIQLTNSRLQQAKEYLKAKKPGNARIFLLGSLQSLQQIIMDLTLSEELPPGRVLHYAIELQQDAFDETIETLDIAEDSQALLPLIHSSQKKVVQSGKRFSEAVFHTQKIQYQKEDGTCQKKPWVSLMPFFHQGFQRAMESQNILALSPDTVPLQYATELQKKTIRFWRHALKLLREEAVEEPVKIEEETEFEQIPQTIEQLMQTLIELEQQDQPKQSRGKELRKEVEKPW